MKDGSTVFVETFSIIPDPRVDRAKRHLLVDIIAIAICALISGADHWIDIEAYAQEKEGWLKTFLQLPNGIPSHDTIARLFARLNPDVFQRYFLNWVKAFAQNVQGEVVAIDGKTLCGSHERDKGLLLLKGAIVTLDAIGCQRTITTQIKEQEADYVLAAYYYPA